MVEKMQFPRIAEADLRLRTDKQRRSFIAAGSALAAANVYLAGLRYVSGIPGAKGFPRILGNKARRPLFAVTVAHSKLIKPAELHAVDGVFRLH